MKIIIDISQNDYEEIKEYGINTFPSVARAIQNGTPLPQGHGRLIDESKIKKCGWNFIYHHAKTDAPTIIEADMPKEGEAE